MQTSVLLHPLSANAAAIIVQAVCRRFVVQQDDNQYIQQRVQQKRQALEGEARAEHDKGLVFCKVDKAVYTVGEYRNGSFKVAVSPFMNPSRLEDRLAGIEPDAPPAQAHLPATLPAAVSPDLREPTPRMSNGAVSVATVARTSTYTHMKTNTAVLQSRSSSLARKPASLFVTAL